jgi:hypothetical protein
VKCSPMFAPIVVRHVACAVAESEYVNYVHNFSLFCRQVDVPICLFYNWGPYGFPLSSLLHGKQISIVDPSVIGY